MTESMLGVAGGLGSSADALAALGALIRIESEHLPVDPDVHAALQDVGVRNGDRIELKQQDALADTAEFSAVWLPLPFLPAAIVPGVLKAVRGSLRPGGWLVAGTFAPGGLGRLAELLMNLRTLRSGGRPWVAAELLPVLTSAGYVDHTQVPRTWAAPVHLFLSRRPNKF